MSLPTFFHATHTCGHQAWWLAPPEFVERATESDCPWCGAETKNVAPPIATIDYGHGIFVMPRSDSGYRSDRGGEVRIIHRADERCCAGALVDRSRWPSVEN